VVFLGYTTLVIFFFKNNLVYSIDWIAQAYRILGFNWPITQGDIFGTLLLFSFLTYVVGLFLQGLIFEWPQFKEHDLNSLRLSFVRLFGYGLLTFIAVGLYGLRLKINIVVNPYDYGLTALITLVFGGIVVVIDDFVGALYIFIKRK
jgi:signal transduction histidine kinase